MNNKDRLSVEDNFNKNWAFLEKSDGSIDKEQLKKELSDYSFVIEQLPKVYCHITSGFMSKHMYHASDVIRVADDHVNELIEEAIKDLND